MSAFPELTNEEMFKVLLCGEKPKGGYSIQDYVEEWNERCNNGTNKDGNGYAIEVK